MSPNELKTGNFSGNLVKMVQEHEEITLTLLKVIDDLKAS
jgi:hypothetical protein